MRLSRFGLQMMLALVAAVASAAVTSAAGGEASVPKTRPASAPSADATANVIRTLERRAREDPENFAVQNTLAAYYLRRARETGSPADVYRAAAAARASLASVPAEGNPSGLAALARSQAAAHEFAAARDSALKLTRLAPTRPYTYEILGDALLELGDYAGAGEAYARLTKLQEDKFGEDDDPTHAARLARMAMLRGDLNGARSGYATAVSLAEALSPPAPDVLAWCLVQSGQLAFTTGDWAAAEASYTAAAVAAPGDWGAIDHLAELRAAQKQFDEAARLYTDLVARCPRPELFQALGDVYAAAGKPELAKPWHARALAQYRAAADAGKAHYFHHLAGFFSDVEPDPPEAVKWARKDLEVRQSAYAHDALAWALYKAGDVSGAAGAIDKALASGTKDAHVLYHASLIYLRAGDSEKGKDCLRRAAEANPKFNAFHVHR